MWLKYRRCFFVFFKVNLYGSIPIHVVIHGHRLNMWMCEMGKEREREGKRERKKKKAIDGLLNAKFIWRRRRHPEELWVRHGTDNTPDEVLVAVTDAAFRGQFGVGEAACQVQQILKSSGVTHAAVLDLVDWWELRDWNQFLLWRWAGI